MVAEKFRCPSAFGKGDKHRYFAGNSSRKDIFCWKSIVCTQCQIVCMHFKDVRSSTLLCAFFRQIDESWMTILVITSCQMVSFDKKLSILKKSVASTLQLPFTSSQVRPDLGNTPVLLTATSILAYQANRVFAYTTGLSLFVCEFGQTKRTAICQFANNKPIILRITNVLWYCQLRRSCSF